MAALGGGSRRIRHVEVLRSVSRTVVRTRNSLLSMRVALTVISTVTLVRRKPSSTGLRTNRASYYWLLVEVSKTSIFETIFETIARLTSEGNTEPRPTDPPLIHI